MRSEFYAARPLILWHHLGSYFLLIWGVGVVRIILIKVVLRLVFVDAMKWVQKWVQKWFFWAAKRGRKRIGPISGH